MNLRKASVDDIPVLAKQHRIMFEEIWKRQNKILDPLNADNVEKAYAKKLETDIPNGICNAWIIEENKNIIAGGAITFTNMMPNPYDLSLRGALLHSMYTDKNYRNQKCAQRIINEIIDFCRTQGIKRITLNASEAGRPVYEKLGFHSTPESMILIIE